VRRYPESKMLSIHRLVQATLKDEMDEQTQLSWAECVIRAVNRVFPTPFGVKSRSDCQRYLSQALVCAGLIEQWNIFLPEAARLLRQTGRYFYQRIQYKEAEKLLDRAVAVSEQTLGREHPETARSFFSLAWNYISKPTKRS